MTITKTENVFIPSSTSSGSGSVSYNTATSTHSGNITLKWLGGSLIFSSVSDYQDFITNVIIPLTNVINSPSGSGSGYVAMIPGVAGSDKVI
jgi:hypothetical protein